MFPTLSWKLREHSDLIKYGYKHNLIYDAFSKKYRKLAYKNWQEFPLKQALSQGFKFSSNTPAGALIEVYLDGIYNIGGFIPERNQLVVDVGANFGDTAIWWAKTFGSKVIAFEPLIDVYKELLENIKLNDAEVVAYNVAVGNGEEINGHTDRNMFSFGGDTQVKTVRLDDYSFDRVDLLKIDVEGFEFEVLQGAKNMITKYKPKIIIETHSTDLRYVCNEFLSSLGYSLRIEGRTIVSRNLGMNRVTNLFYTNSNSIDTS